MKHTRALNVALGIALLGLTDAFSLPTLAQEAPAPALDAAEAPAAPMDQPAAALDQTPAMLPVPAMPQTSTPPALAPVPTVSPTPQLVPGSDSLRAEPKRLRDYNLPGLDAKVKLTSLQPWDVVQLIEFLAYRGGINNIVIGKGVAGMTTKLKFEDVTVGDALEIVLSVNQLAYEIKGGVITIMTDAEYTQVHGSSFYDNKQVKVLALKYADAAHVASILAPLKSAIGTVVADPVTASLILIDTPEKVQEMSAVAARTDIDTVSRVVPTESKTFVLKYANVEDIQTQITPMISKEAGSLRTDARTKTLIVTDLANNLRKIESLVATFDVPKRQVFIEAKIVSVLLTDDYRLGINWDHLFDNLDPRAQVETRVTRTAILGQQGGVGTLSYRTILAGGDLKVVLDALKSVGETKVLSNPHVAVMSDEEATIKVVRNEPYAEAQLESGTTNVVGEQIKFIEVGVKLGVTPRVNEDGWISMAIKPEVSDVVGQYQAFRLIPVVQSSYAETSVMIHDGETVIIGGMIQNRKDQGQDRVPFLGRIPLIGVLFRSDRKSFSTEETVVFLSPRVIKGESPTLLSRDIEKPVKPLRSPGGERVGE